MNLTNTLADVFSAPRRALSLTKILIFFRANLVGYSMYLFANYLSLILAGLTLNEIWTNEGLYPCAHTYNIPWYSMMLFWGSVINWILMIYGSIGVAAKHTICELKKNYFISIDEAHEKVKKIGFQCYLAQLAFYSSSHSTLQWLLFLGSLAKFLI